MNAHARTEERAIARLMLVGAINDEGGGIRDGTMVLKPSLAKMLFLFCKVHSCRLQKYHITSKHLG